MKRSGTQGKLLDAEARLPSGLVYKPEFIAPEEEELLIEFIRAHRLKHARGGPAGKYEAKRRHADFGAGYDYKRDTIIPGPPLPRFLARFAHRIEKWRGWPRGMVIEALVNEYAPGTALGFHRDNEKFEHIVGISLGGWARMKFRPMKTRGVSRRAAEVFSVEMEPRSAYVMQDSIRWEWQHAVAATRALRYSITFRTLPKGMRPTASDRGRYG
ncbi:MAG TPA: alpha-ketoglutarate-dependent dioxygenase AlkB [Candidatus Paceibacterota bacterium]|nr:alpha-ketoglutarate-dependent dioxygenase AlkB [Candidatus Paceibacterota bacterium]